MRIPMRTIAPLCLLLFGVVALSAHRKTLTIDSFSGDTCSNSLSLNTYHWFWSVSGSTTGYSWEIWDTANSTDYPTTGHFEVTGTIGKPNVIVQLTTGSPHNLRWVWLRYTNGTDSTAWVGHDNNAWDVISSCPV